MVPSFFLKLSFFCVFATDFCYPPGSSGLAPGMGHEKRWHLGMARLLQGDTGHGAGGGGRLKLMSAWGSRCSGTRGVGWVGSNASLSGARRCPKQGVRNEVARQSQAGCSMHLPGCPHSCAFRTYKLAHGCWWCVHICVGVCGMLRTFYGSRLTATFMKRECG